MTITRADAYEAMRTQHRLLTEQLSSRVTAVLEAVEASRPHGPAVAELIAYMADEVLPHAVAEENTIYPAAAAQDDLTGTVSEMLAEHKTLSAAAEALAGAGDGRTAAEQAREVAELFTAHAARENDVLLPALLASIEVDLAALLAQLHRRAEEAVRPPSDGSLPGLDLQAAILGIVLEATRALASGGQADLACQLAAAVWAALREDRPDLTIHVTAALHALGRPVSGEPARAPGSQAMCAGR